MPKFLRVFYVKLENPNRVEVKGGEALKYQRTPTYIDFPADTKEEDAKKKIFSIHGDKAVSIQSKIVDLK